MAEEALIQRTLKLMADEHVSKTTVPSVADEAFIEQMTVLGMAGDKVIKNNSRVWPATCLSKHKLFIV